MKNLILLTVLILTLSCSKSDETEPVVNFTPTTINPLLIGKSSISNPSPPLVNMLVSNQVQWIALINSLNATNNVSNNFTSTTIDFNNFNIIAVFRNPIANSTSTVDITNILENQTNIIVTVQNLTNGISTDVAQPFHIVKIPKSTKPLIFQ